MSKRGAREGEIIHRKDGRWEARVTIGSAGRRKSVYGRTRGAVVRGLQEVRARETHGALVSGRSATVEQFLNRWLSEVAAKHVRPSTFERYQEIVAHHLIPSLGPIKLERLGVEPIQEMLNAKAEQGLSTEKIRGVLRNALNVAIKWRLLTWNPAELADLPRWAARKPRFLQVAEADRLLQAARGDRLEAIYVLALSMAMREGELLGLRWSDCDLTARRIHIQVQLQPVRALDGEHRRSLQLVDVKSEMGRRTIPMPEMAYEALTAHREGQKITSLQGLVFATSHGTPIGARNLLRSFKDLLRRVELPADEIRFHDLRHSCASFLIARGVDPKTVQAILGHSTVRLTMDTYVHAMPEALRDAARQMDRVLGVRV